MCVIQKSSGVEIAKSALVFHSFRGRWAPEVNFLVHLQSLASKILMLT